LGGQIDVQVVGSRGDGQPPSVASGKILTPTVSRARFRREPSTRTRWRA
jgi:hypothetical protein